MASGGTSGLGLVFSFVRRNGLCLWCAPTFPFFRSRLWLINSFCRRLRGRFMKRNSFKRCVLLALVAGLLGAGGTRAQNVGSLDGSVLDPTGANVGGAAVKIVDLANHAPRATKTDASGVFSFAQINP